MGFGIYYIYTVGFPHFVSVASSWLVDPYYCQRELKGGIGEKETDTD